MAASLRWGAATHPGQVRMNNEDAYAADDGMWVVADGMGGHLAGEVASAYTIDALRAANRVGITSTDDMVDAVQQANDTIRHEAQTNPGRRGMGTTVTALAVMHHPENPQLIVANVGDSRTYVWRDGQLLPVTVDHSYVQELVSGGEITVEEARTHPRRNIVTRALGIEPGVVVDTWTLAAVRGDRYILCSDGLVDEVTDEEIAAVVGAEADPQLAAERLVAVANQNGGRDNVTVVVVDVVDGDDFAPPAPVVPPVEPVAPDTTDEDDTARINRTLQIDVVPAEPAAAAPPAAATSVPVGATVDPAVADGSLDPGAAPLAEPDGLAAPTPLAPPPTAPATGDGDVAAAQPGATSPADPLPPPANREVYVDGRPLGTTAAEPATQPALQVPAVLAPRKRSKATIAFWAALGAITLTVLVVLILAVTGGDDDGPTPSTTAPATSTSAPTTTDATTTTTRPPASTTTTTDPSPSTATTLPGGTTVAP